jgi:hypothetical protein
VRTFWLGQATPADAATRYNKVCSILELFWERLVAELTTHLDGSVSGTRGVRIYDVVLFLDPAGRGTAPLVQMARVREETDGEGRHVVYFKGFTCFNRAMTSVVMRCSTAGAVNLHMMDCVHTSSLMLEVERLLALRPRPSVFMADGGADFNGGDSALEDIKGKGRINLARAQLHFDTKFQFAPPGAPHFQGLVERFVGATRAAVHSEVHTHTLADKELSAVFSRVMGRLNNVPVVYTMKVRANFQHLDSWVSKTRGVKIDDVDLLLDPARRGAAPLVRMARVRDETDREVRRVVCFDGFEYFDRAMTGVVMRCSRTGAVHLHIMDCVRASSLMLEVEGLLALRPRPSVFMQAVAATSRGAIQLCET